MSSSGRLKPCAGYLGSTQASRRANRVLLLMQKQPANTHHCYFAILRANVVVVPVNPMNRSAESKPDRGTPNPGRVIAQKLLEQSRGHVGAKGHFTRGLSFTALLRIHLESTTQPPDAVRETEHRA